VCDPLLEAVPVIGSPRGSSTRERTKSRNRRDAEESPTSAHTDTLRFRVKQNDIVAPRSASYAQVPVCDRGNLEDGDGGCEANDSIEPKPEAAQSAAAEIPLAEVRQIPGSGGG
jgi:hypothetical protein